jgi:thiamine pyrophosphokinase
MEKLLKKFKTKDDFDRFSKILYERIKENKPISDKPMIDGMIIVFILTTDFAIDLFLQNDIGRVLDGTIQKFEQMVIWCANNEDELCSLL